MPEIRHLEADSMEASALGRAPVHMIERKGCHMYYGVTNCKAVCNPALRAGICAAILFLFYRSTPVPAILYCSGTIASAMKNTKESEASYERKTNIILSGKRFSDTR